MTCGWPALRLRPGAKASPREIPYRHHALTRLARRPRRAAVLALRPSAGDPHGRVPRSVPAGCGHRWWVSDWKMCRSYQNCASRREPHGRGSQAAQLILVLPSAVRSSTGRCVAVWWGRVMVVACISALLADRSARACWPFFPAGRFQTRPCGLASGNRHPIPGRHRQACHAPGGAAAGRSASSMRHAHRWPWRLGVPGLPDGLPRARRGAAHVWG
jgi:hypothetical protein